MIDEDDATDAVTWYADADADGHGDPDSTWLACEQPSGFVANSDDCDDSDGAISPDGVEVCDGADNDCDGTTDEDDVTDALTWYADADGGGYGASGGTTRPSCDQPSGFADNTDDCDDTDPNINPGETEVCSNGVDDDCDGTIDSGCPIEHCGNISSDETWDASVEHLVTCGVSVYGSSRPVLTIEDGTTVEFEAGTNLYVGTGNYGGLDVQGTSTGVTFTSSQSAPAAGDWDGLYFGYYDLNSTVEGLTIEYGGGNGYGNIYLYFAEPLITGTVSRYSSRYGLYANSSSFPTVTDSSFTDNDSGGLYFAASAGLDDSGGPTFTDNQVTDNGGNPVTIPGMYVGQLDPSSTYSGNTDDTVVVSTDVITEDTTWLALDVDYEVSGVIGVYGSARPELTIDDGVTLQMDAGTAINVGTGNYGSIDVQGSSTGVTFTSAKGSSARAGDWDGLSFGYYDLGSTLAGLTVSHAGGNGYGGIYLYYASPDITDCTVQSSTTHGIYANSGSYPTISGCVLQDNDNSGLFASSGAGLETTGGPTFTDNTLTGNGDYPLVLSPEYAGQLDSSSTYTGNGDDQVYVRSGTVSSDATWQALDADWLIAGDVTVGASTSPELEIERGAQLEFDHNASLQVGTGNYGSLYAVGTSADPVVFTSAQSSPSAGDWDGITLGYYAIDSSTTIQYATIEYGGGNGYGNVYFYYCDATVWDSTMQYSSTWGAYRNSSTPDLINNSYNGNASGTIY